MTAQTAVYTFRSFAELHAHLGAMIDGEIAPIPGVPEEAYVIEGGQPRRVKACVLPEGYLETLLTNAADETPLSSGSQPRSVRMTAAEVQVYNDQAIEARNDANGAGPAYTPRVLPDLTAKKREEFHPSQMVENPADLIDAGQLQTAMRDAMRTLVSIGDYDPALEIVALKMWDGLAYLAERAKFNVVEDAERTKKRIAELRRQADDTEIHDLQLDRQLDRLQGLRVQAFHFSQMLKVALAEREKAVAISGINWPAYKSLKDRADYGAAAYRQKQRNRVSNSDYLLTISAAEYGQWKRSNDGFYKPRRDGIDAEQSHTQPMADPS